MSRRIITTNSTQMILWIWNHFCFRELLIFLLVFSSLIPHFPKENISRKKEKKCNFYLSLCSNIPLTHCKHSRKTPEIYLGNEKWKGPSYLMKFSRFSQSRNYFRTYTLWFPHFLLIFFPLPYCLMAWIVLLRGRQGKEINFHRQCFCCFQIKKNCFHQKRRNRINIWKHPITFKCQFLKKKIIIICIINNFILLQKKISEYLLAEKQRRKEETC